jgi:hypothetical protein
MIRIGRNVEIELTIFGGHPISTNMPSTKEEASIFCTYSLRVEGDISDYFCAAIKNLNCNLSHAF